MEAPQNLYIGSPPHGAIRAVVEGEIDGNNTIVKFNYGGPDISAKEVVKDPDKWLKAITVMKRIPGYNPKIKIGSLQNTNLMVVSLKQEKLKAV